MFGFFLETFELSGIFVEELLESAHVASTLLTLSFPIFIHIAGVHALISELLIIASSFIGLFKSVFDVCRIKSNVVIHADKLINNLFLLLL